MEKKEKKNPTKNHLGKTGLGQTAVFELWNINYQSHTDLSLSRLSQNQDFLKPRFPTLSTYFDLFQENTWLIGDQNKPFRWQAKITFHCRTVQEWTRSYRCFLNWTTTVVLNRFLSIQTKVAFYHFKILSDKRTLSTFYYFTLKV